MSGRLLSVLSSRLSPLGHKGIRKIYKEPLLTGQINLLTIGYISPKYNLLVDSGVEPNRLELWAGISPKSKLPLEGGAEPFRLVSTYRVATHT